MNHISREHPVIIGLACATTGLRVETHYPIGVALKIIQATTGDTLGSYETLIKVSEEAWNARDIRTDTIHGITWEKLQVEGQSIEEVQNEIGVFLKIHQLTTTAFFMSFNFEFHKTFFRKILGGNRLIVPEESLFNLIVERSISNKMRKTSHNVEIDFPIDGEDLGYLNYPQIHHNRFVGIPNKRTLCLRLLNLRLLPGVQDHHYVANDIWRVVNAILNSRL